MSDTGPQVLSEPPPILTGKHNGKYDWDSVAAYARKHKGKWVMAATGVLTAHAQQIRAGKKAAFRDEKGNVVFEVTTRSRQGKGDIWVRFVGKPVTPSKRKAVSREPAEGTDG